MKSIIEQDNWLQDNWLEKVEKMEPEEIEAMLKPQLKTRNLPKIPKLNNPLNRFWDAYNSLSYWEKKSFENDMMLVGLLAIVPLIFVFPYISVYGLPGQFRGAYQWANAQDTPTKINYCQNRDFGGKRCSFRQKNNKRGYIESDNGSEWRNILDD